MNPRTCSGRPSKLVVKLLVLVVSLALMAPSTTANLLNSDSSPSSTKQTQAFQQVSSNQNRLKKGAAIGDLWQRYSSNSHHFQADKPTASSGKYQRTLAVGQHNLVGRAAAQTSGLASALNTEAEYRCAKYCSCSIVQVLDRGKSGNLTRASCESAPFSDLLTIDRRTQIIHISLPAPSNGFQAANERDEQSETVSASQPAPFRMPRLVQFNILREIVIINLKFEVCDSEVFKRGQKLRRLQLNRNQLSRISKACLKHLEKLLELNLDHNQLEELESALFNSLLSLRSLSIAYNKLSELAAHQFANLTNLVSLNLVGNTFKTINLHLLEPMQASLRLLVLADNQIKSFVYAPQQQQQQQQQQLLAKPVGSNSTTGGRQASASPLFAGALFKNLIKLNVDRNKFERVKSLQLHRFYNIKFLSIRQNVIATIRDKAFNGLKLIELNLAQNQLQSITKCAFCNATVKRLVLAHNNITLPLPLDGGQQPANAPFPRPFASVTSGSDSGRPPAEQAAQVASASVAAAAAVAMPIDQTGALPSASSSQSMLILSQSIFGPLFGQLEYLDLSNNELLANQLDYLLEPLLNLEYLNIAAVGLDRSLPSPSLFKNLRQLRYLNISRNQLDQIIAETIEPLSQLEVLDLSYNKFSELEETFLVAADELGALKLINLSSNPWFCSQCKVAPLYDWILRSAIYNSTCIATAYAEQQQQQSGSEGASDLATDDSRPSAGSQDGLAYSPQSTLAGRHDYSLLIGDDQDKGAPSMDFDLILGSALDDDLLGSYNLLGSQSATNSDSSTLTTPTMLPTANHQTIGIKDLAIQEDDETIALTMNAATILERVQPRSADYCLKCEFPGELHTYNIHELTSGDFKFCAGAAPRFAASEPKLGLTLAIVIIAAFICIIIVVILMYRKKSNTYYTNEDTDHLQTGKKPGLSVSSDVERQYGDGTDYSSPPMSQSFESYTSSQEDADLDDEDLNEDEEGDDDEEEDDEEEEEDEEEEDDEEAEIRETGENNKRDGHKHQVELDAGGSDKSAQAQALNRLASAEQERRQQVADYERHENTLKQGRQSSQQSVRSGSSQSQRKRSTGALSNRQAVEPGGGAPTTGRAYSKEGSSRSGPSPARRSQQSISSNPSLKGSAISHKIVNRPDAQPTEQPLSEPQTADSTIVHIQHQLASSASGGSRALAVGRVKSSQSAGSQTQPPVKLAGSQSVQSNEKRLDSAGSFVSVSRRVAPPAGRLDESNGELDLNGPSRSARERTQEVGGDRQQAGKRARAVYQITSGLRPQSSGGSGTHVMGVESPSAISGVHSVGPPNRLTQLGRQQPMSSHRLHRVGQLGRQRFALSKDLSQPQVVLGQSRPNVPEVGPQLTPREDLQVIQRSEEEEDLDPELLLLAEAARRADLIAMEGRRCSPASDATTADSLALEALADYEAPESEPEEAGQAGSFGAVLAVADGGSSAEDYELDLDHERPVDEHLLQVFRQSRQPNASSCHSALTQTGSRDLDDI